MGQKMPMRDFKWIDNNVVAQVKAEHIAKLNPDGNKGYIFEIDAKIPQELHDRYIVGIVGRIAAFKSIKLILKLLLMQ